MTEEAAPEPLKTAKPADWYAWWLEGYLRQLSARCIYFHQRPYAAPHHQADDPQKSASKQPAN